MKEFKNKVLYIPDDETLDYVKDVIVRNGFNVSNDCFFLSQNKSFNYLYLNDFYEDEGDVFFSISEKDDFQKEISIKSFNKIFNNYEKQKLKSQR